MKKLFLPLLENGRIFFSSHSHMFVPANRPVLEEELNILQNFLRQAGRLFVMTGAGVSTESGIPDYRSEKVGLYARTDHRPIQYQEFLKSADRRQKYWARNFVAWPQFSSFQPNICHEVLAQWEREGRISWLVTQNVDALHTKAGSRRVTELHGCSHRVHCLNCSYEMTRSDMQKLITEFNPDWNIESVDIAPDGDVQLKDEQVKDFKVPHCPNCEGVLKPEIIFFGDNVARSTVNFVFEKIRECDSVLLLGTSLYIYSGYRFVLAAHEQKKPIGAVNIGKIRGDNLLDFQINARCGKVFEHLKITSAKDIIG